MKNLSILAFIILLFGTIGCSLSGKNNERENYLKPPTETLPPVNDSQKINSSNAASLLLFVNYEQIKNGMSYEEVVKIIGSGGTETRRSNIENIELRSHKWKGDNYQRIYVNFRNNKVISKSQSGLN